MTYSTSGRRQKFPHTKTTDPSVFNRPSQVGLSAPPKPDTPGRNPESPEPSSRQGQQERRESRVGKEPEAPWDAHSPSCVGRAGPETSPWGDLCPRPVPLPWPRARDRPPEASYPGASGASGHSVRAAKAAAPCPGSLPRLGPRPPARLPGPRADARGGESCPPPPKKGPERSCRCPARRPSRTPRPSADGTGGRSQGRGSSRPRALLAGARRPLLRAHSGRARRPPVSPASPPPTPSGPTPSPGRRGATGRGEVEAGLWVKARQFGLGPPGRASAWLPARPRKTATPAHT